MSTVRALDALHRDGAVPPPLAPEFVEEFLPGGLDRIERQGLSESPSTTPLCVSLRSTEPLHLQGYCGPRSTDTRKPGDVEPWLDCFHYPLTLIGGPGEVNTMDDADAMRAAYGDWAGQALPISYSAEVLAAGDSGVTLAQSITRGDESFQQAFLVAERDGEWKILAVSAVH